MIKNPNWRVTFHWAVYVDERKPSSVGAGRIETENTSLYMFRTGSEE